MTKALFIIDVQHAQFFVPTALSGASGFMSRTGDRLLHGSSNQNGKSHLEIEDEVQRELEVAGAK